MRIVTVHDVFRSSVFDLPDPESSIGPWFHELIGPLLTRLGHEVHRFTLMRDGVPEALIDAADRYQLRRDHTGWTWFFSDPDALDVTAEIIAPLFDYDLIVGFEINPNVVLALSRAGKRFLDITQDPIRFCPDLFFRIRGNLPDIETKLSAWRVPDATVSAEAARLRAGISSGYDGSPAVLFTGQVNIDSSLIANARLTRITPFIDQIDQLRKGRTLLLKPHPMAPNSQDLLTLYDQFPDSRYITTNIYSLLAAPAIEQIVTLSSSTASEAVWFDKPALSLITPDILAPPPSVVSPFHRVDARLTSTAFWAGLLHDMPAFIFMEPPPKPLRQLFSPSWGYTRDMMTPVSKNVAINETISFAQGGRGAEIELFGWSTPEDWGVWSDGPIAMLQFILPDAATDPNQTLAVELTFGPFVPDAAHPLDVTIATRHGSKHLLFETDAPVIMTLPVTSGVVELRFNVPDCQSPHALGMNPDTRLLGIGLQRLTPRVIRIPEETAG